MTLRQIVSLPDPVLRKKARPISTFDKNLQTLIDDMIETMREAPGVGLAAPQVGIPERLAVIEYSEDEEKEDEQENDEEKTRPIPKKRMFVIINPEIVKASDEKVMGVEGCLSIPGLVGEVERHEMIQVKALNRHGKPVKIKAEGWLARIFQHEIDHLNGVLFPDLAERVWQPQPDEEEDLV
jgi:peptide deformylase